LTHHEFSSSLYGFGNCRGRRACVAKVERAIQFTEFQVKAHLTIPAGADEEKAKKLLEKAENTCFITNSLKAEPHLEATITTG